MTISTARHQVLLHEQSSVAQKVFEAVPMQEVWSSQQIHGALQRTTRSTMDYKILQGCLNTLKEAGLVHEPKAGCFERVKQRPQTYVHTLKEAGLDHIPRDPMPTASVSPINGSRSAAAEVLYELSNRARNLSLDLAAAASMIDDEIEENAESAQKLSQLQSILKGLA
jgi:hypothetical protein